MEDILIVVDMQNDFVNGTLGTKEAQTIVDNVVKKIKEFKGCIFFTKDTHSKAYSYSLEGKYLPIIHCIKGTKGWEFIEPLKAVLNENVYEKNTFASIELAQRLKAIHEEKGISSITIIGICTDICVVSNALLLKAFLPEVEIFVDTLCCAGTSPENHEHALFVMKSCQINVIMSEKTF